MADTKKEHYVPRCYLRNFAFGSDRINVFDKSKMQVRTNQKLLDVAMENHFYDLDFDKYIKKEEPEVQEKIVEDLKHILGADDISEAMEKLGGDKHIEQQFFSPLEGVYSEVLRNVIKKSYGGNKWVMENCWALSYGEKDILSFFIAVQIIRTKSFRDTIGSTFEQFVQALAYKVQMHDTDALPRDAFEVSVNEDNVKLEHSNMILDPEMAISLASAIREHIWVIYVNKTAVPFWTSDDPVVNIPHKHDQFISYSGLKSEGIEILFPISSDLLLGMYDAQLFGNMLSDRKFLPANLDMVEYSNRAQVIHSQRCVFSHSDDFSLAEKICTENPKFREVTTKIEVS